MPTYYIPIRANPIKVMGGLMPHTDPMKEQMYFTSPEAAKAHLAQHPVAAYYGMPNAEQQSKEPIRFGARGEQLNWPNLDIIYKVDITDEQKLVAIQKNGKATLDPTSVLTVNTHFERDALHKEWEVPEIQPTLGSHIQMQHIADQMQLRGENLQRIYNVLARSGPREREQLDLKNPEHADIINKICVYDIRKKLKGPLEEQAMTTVLRQLGKEIGVRSVLAISAGQIESEFNARLEALPPETPAAERVSVAMSATLNKFAGIVPSRDASVFLRLESKIQGVVNDLAQEIKSERITDFELGGLPDELRPAWFKVPEDDKDEFIQEFERQRKEHAEASAAADREAFLATTFAMQHAAAQAGNALTQEAYNDVLAEVNALEEPERSAIE